MKEKVYFEKFVNGKLDDYFPWRDTDGNLINASDGGIIRVEDKYYWYGMALRPLPVAFLGKGGQTTTVGVVMYSSTDLYNWDYEGVILACSKDRNNPLFAPMRFERPKIIFNEKTKKFVLWCHYVKFPGDHGVDQGTGEAGVAVCDTVNGSYEWLGDTRPIDDKGIVRDCTVFKDSEGTAYFIYDRDVDDNRCLHVVKLSEDYLSMTDSYQRVESANRREAAAVLFSKGYYYILTSGLTGWKTNQLKYYRTKNLLEPWTDMGDPCVNDYTKTSFESQGTYILPIDGDNSKFIYMAERHNTENFERCSYIWLPIEFPTDDTLQLTYRQSWSLAEL